MHVGCVRVHSLARSLSLVCVLGGIFLQPGREGGESRGPFGDPDQKICLGSCGQVSLSHQDSERYKARVRDPPVVTYKGTSGPWWSAATQEDHLGDSLSLQGEKEYCMRPLAPGWPVRNVLCLLLQVMSSRPIPAPFKHGGR